MSSGGGPEGYCRLCGKYSQSRTIKHGGLCLACEGKKERGMNEYNMGGLIPDPQFNLNERFSKLEARIAEMEKEMLKLEKPNPIRWGELVGEKTVEALRSLGWGHPNEIQHLKARIAELEKQNDSSRRTHF